MEGRVGRQKGGFMLNSVHNQKEDIRMSVGEKITLIRKDNNLSQEAMGEALGVSRQAISKWESGVSHS